ncbi:MAG: hypothetical protein LBL74_01045 [Bacteroidales bacterium]|jgi:hypothetical protein|nr:hypothetical protein [Bacteroidales bacterium]
MDESFRALAVRVAPTLFDLMALARRFRVVLLKNLTFEGRFVGLKPHLRALEVRIAPILFDFGVILLKKC